MYRVTVVANINNNYNNNNNVIIPRARDVISSSSPPTDRPPPGRWPPWELAALLSMAPPPRAETAAVAMVTTLAATVSPPPPPFLVQEASLSFSLSVLPVKHTSLLSRLRTRSVNVRGIYIVPAVSRVTYIQSVQHSIGTTASRSSRKIRFCSLYTGDETYLFKCTDTKRL